MNSKAKNKKRILFSGYAPVHFVCFLPVYQRLQQDPRVELWLSGGFKQEIDGETTYSLKGFFDPFLINRDRVIPIEQARKEDFDVLVCAHLSDSLFPRSVKKTVQIFHGVSFKNFAVREKALRFELLCLPGKYHASCYRERGLIRPNGSMCLLTGFPKMDAFFTGALDRNAILQRIGVDPEKPTLLYAPTGGKKNSLETMGEELIQNLSKETAWNLLIKPHDHPKKKIDWFARLSHFENERVRLVREKDVLPYLYAADLLLSDASSVAVEYTLLDRPIVFLDVPKLLSNVTAKGAALDLDTYGRKIGTLVRDVREVVPAVKDSLAHPEREGEIRKTMAKDVFYDPGRAAARVAGVVLYAAGLECSLPDDAKVLEPDPVVVDIHAREKIAS